MVTQRLVYSVIFQDRKGILSSASVTWSSCGSKEDTVRLFLLIPLLGLDKVILPRLRSMQF